jgi:translation elongation factor EF-Ts
MHIEDIRNVNKMSAELLVRLYALKEQENVQEEKELIQDFIGELDCYIKEFARFESEKIIEFEKRERGE